MKNSYKRARKAELQRQADERHRQWVENFERLEAELAQRNAAFDTKEDD